MSIPKPSDLPRLLQSVKDKHQDSLTASLDDTMSVFNIFHREQEHEPLIAAILTHCTLTNQILEDDVL